MSAHDLTQALGDFFASTWPNEEIPDGRELSVSGWTEFLELGLNTVGIDEDFGGSGGDFADATAVAILSGRHAADIPAIEANLAAWCLTEASQEVDSSAVLTVPFGSSELTLNSDGTLRGEVRGVPWGQQADAVVAFTTDGQTVTFDPQDASVRPGADLAGQPRADFTLEDVAPKVVSSGTTAEAFRLRALSLRSAQLAGALRAIADLTTKYVKEREQFGQAIGRFQAVQEHLVILEQSAVMTDALARRLALGPTLIAFDVTAARLVTINCAQAAAKAAHQAHGAIGMTREYRLQAFTRRIHAWSGDLSGELELADELGSIAANAPSFAGLVFDTHNSSEV